MLRTVEIEDVTITLEPGESPYPYMEAAGEWCWGSVYRIAGTVASSMSVRENFGARPLKAWNANNVALEATGLRCSHCREENNAEDGEVGTPCGRDLSEERGEPEGTTICPGYLFLVPGPNPANA